jgi:hypothetical protein
MFIERLPLKPFSSKTSWDNANQTTGLSFVTWIKEKMAPYSPTELTTSQLETVALFGEAVATLREQLAMSDKKSDKAKLRELW